MAWYVLSRLERASLSHSSKYHQYVHANFPTKVTNPTAVWIGYPHIPLAAPVKFYYLVQTACYLHQTLILNAEARRKDHWQMMCHHVVTVALLVLSYFTNFNRVGCLILMLMDCCDIFLPVSLVYRLRRPSFFAQRISLTRSLKKSWPRWSDISM